MLHNFQSYTFRVIPKSQTDQLAAMKLLCKSWISGLTDKAYIVWFGEQIKSFKRVIQSAVFIF